MKSPYNSNAKPQPIAPPIQPSRVFVGTIAGINFFVLPIKRPVKYAKVSVAKAPINISHM